MIYTRLHFELTWDFFPERDWFLRSLPALGLLLVFAICEGRSGYIRNL